MGPNQGDGGASLHYGDPWAPPPAERDPLRRLRGHLVLPVTIWLAEMPGGNGPVGLTVSSVFFAQGEPPLLAGLVAPLSDLASVVEKPGTGFVVHVLGAGQRRLAQHFAGELPAPEDMLAATASAHGPLLGAVPDRALCRSSAARPFGWSLLVEAVVEEVEVAPTGNALAWWHGGYRSIAG